MDGAADGMALGLADGLALGLVDGLGVTVGLAAALSTARVARARV